MNRLRIATLVAAAVITATQWAPFFSTVPNAAAVRAVTAPAMDDEAAGALPVIVVTAHQRS
jgi:hypothetical protein